MISPPTSFLPPLIRLQQHSSSHLSSALHDLEQLYWPARRFLTPSTHVDLVDTVPDSGYSSVVKNVAHDPHATTKASELLDRLEVLRGDPFERQFSITWLTGFISRFDSWNSGDIETRGLLLDKASSILSAFVSGEEEEEEPAVTRLFEFPGVVIQLNDAPLGSDHTSVGLQSWGSAVIFSALLCETPDAFFPPSCRVLELGSGTGLLSIVASKLGCLDIVATDYHPDVLNNLRDNVATNSTAASVPIAVHALDWESPTWSKPFDSPFDVILAADVIYHAQHAEWIKNCVERLLSEDGVFWLAIPLRSHSERHAGMALTVLNVFGGEGKLGILSQEDLARKPGVGRADEAGYILFKIGWQ